MIKLLAIFLFSFLARNVTTLSLFKNMGNVDMNFYPQKWAF